MNAKSLLIKLGRVGMTLQLQLAKGRELIAQADVGMAVAVEQIGIHLLGLHVNRVSQFVNRRQQPRRRQRCQIRLRMAESAMTQIRIRTDMPTTSVQLDTPQKIMSQVLPARP
jgi:hypothetical protein